MAPDRPRRGVVSAIADHRHHQRAGHRPAAGEPVQQQPGRPPPDRRAVGTSTSARTGAVHSGSSTPASIAPATGRGWRRPPGRAAGTARRRRSAGRRRRNAPTATGQPPGGGPVATSSAAPGVDQATLIGIRCRSPSQAAASAACHAEREQAGGGLRVGGADRPQPGQHDGERAGEPDQARSPHRPAPVARVRPCHTSRRRSVYGTQACSTIAGCAPTTSPPPGPRRRSRRHRPTGPCPARGTGDLAVRTGPARRHRQGHPVRAGERHPQPDPGDAVRDHRAARRAAHRPARRAAGRAEHRDHRPRRRGHRDPAGGVHTTPTRPTSCTGCGSARARSSSPPPTSPASPNTSPSSPACCAPARRTRR